jgi:hypothetical protein
MKLVIEINCDNAAFQYDLRGEVHRCLIDVIETVSVTRETGSIRDTNGNKVGAWKFS